MVAIKDILDNALELYYNMDFIPDDPVQIPHRFNLKQDIEIAAFITATLAWGQRTTIINNANKLMELMDNAPYDFIKNHTKNDLVRFDKFVHRTFNYIDLQFFITRLNYLYSKHSSLEEVFCGTEYAGDMVQSLGYFNTRFFGTDYPQRTLKHISNAAKGSACKRLNLFLKWMVRKDEKGIDFGIWNTIKPSELLIPLDVHVHYAALKLRLTKRKQSDIKTVVEITQKLRKIDLMDPVKYDFALFGIGKNR